MSNTFKVVFVAPPHDGYYNGSRYESQGITQLAAILRDKKITVKVIDAFLQDLSVEDTVDLILKSIPEVMLGFSLMQFAQFRSFVSVMNLLNLQGISLPKIVVGGAYPTVAYKEILDRDLKIDLIAISESDLVIYDLYTDLARNSNDWQLRKGFAYKYGNQIINTGYPDIPESIDDLPTPNHDNLIKSLELGWPAVIHSSRGCDWGSCTFCCIGRRYPGETKVRRRSVSSVIDEIQLFSKYKTPFILFTDDNFLNNSRTDSKWLYDFIERMQRLKLYIPFGISTRINSLEPKILEDLCSIGLKSVFLGIEGCLPRTLKLFNKGYNVEDIHTNMKMILSHSVIVACGFIMFDPEASISDIRNNIDFMRLYPFMGRFQLNQVHILPEAPLKQYYARKNMLTLCETGLKAIYNDPSVNLVKETASLYQTMSMETVGSLFACWFHRLTLHPEDPLVALYDEIAAQVRIFDLDILTRWCDMASSNTKFDTYNEASIATISLQKHLKALNMDSVVSEINAKTKWSARNE